MALKKGTKVDRGYATVAIDEGENYRDIAETMTSLDIPMNHSSARNHVLRVMRKFVTAYSEEFGYEMTPKQIDEVAKSPSFQQALAEKLHVIEMDRRENDARSLFSSSAAA
jgi:hypothetical protein